MSADILVGGHVSASGGLYRAIERATELEMEAAQLFVGAPQTWRATNHTDAAIEQGRGAARTLLAGEKAEPVGLVPRFWSSQHGLRIEVCGRLDAEADIEITRVRRGALPRAGVLAGYRVDGVLTGVAAINAPYEFIEAAKGILSAEHPRRAARRHLAMVS